MSGILEGARTTKSTLPGHLPTWSILTVILALALGIAVGMYHWWRDNNGLQRWYFTSYIRSSLSESSSFRGKGPSRYQVIDLVDDRYPDQTLTTVTDEDAVVTGNKDGALTLKYAESGSNGNTSEQLSERLPWITMLCTVGCRNKSMACKVLVTYLNGR
jgi:hypothetical protein